MLCFLFHDTLEIVCRKSSNDGETIASRNSPAALFIRSSDSTLISITSPKLLILVLRKPYSSQMVIPLFSQELAKSQEGQMLQSHSKPFQNPQTFGCAIQITIFHDRTRFLKKSSVHRTESTITGFTDLNI